MASETVPAGTEPAVAAPADAPRTQWEALNAADTVLSEISHRAEAIRFLLDEGELFDMAAAESTKAYSLISALDLLVSDIARKADDGIQAVAQAMQLGHKEASHG